MRTSPPIHNGRYSGMCADAVRKITVQAAGAQRKTIMPDEHERSLRGYTLLTKKVMTRIALVIALFSISFDIFAQAEPGRKSKKTLYEEVDVEDLMKRYFAKSFGHSIEGIYSVSCVITKRNKRFLSKSERIRVVAREDNYAKVAIMKDWPASGRGFIEVSLSYRKSNSFPIMGELDAMAEGGGFIYT